MAIKDLIVAFDGNEASRKAVLLALQMCRKYDAGLTGIYIQRTDGFESHVRRWIAEDVLQQLERSGQEAASAVKAAFEELIAQAEFPNRCRWHSEGGAGSVGVPIARLARYHDILLIGQFASGYRDQRNAVDPEELVLRVGKPVIIVPRSYQPAPFREEAVVAWDGSRQASRALTDAMQILETKQRLDVVTVAVDGFAGTDLGSPGRDLVGHLKRHGINAKHVQLTAKRKIDVGSVLLGYCADTRPDILVAGAFGQNKIGSRLFGGISQYLLENMTLPVLMSH